MDLIKDHVDDWRLFGLVPYNISPIQQGIQFGHALQELNNAMIDNKIEDKKLIDGFDSWRKFGKTFIVLNGGTTNKRIIDEAPFGSLNQHLITLRELGVSVFEFYEPDLGEQLSAIVFLVPKQVFNKKEFPNFREYVNEKFEDNEDYANYVNHLFKNDMTHTDKEVEEIYIEWVELLGGNNNVELRNFLSKFDRA
jgi:hypothetical protein